MGDFNIDINTAGRDVDKLDEFCQHLVNREFRKEIYKRSRLRNKFWKDPSKENELLLRPKETNASHCGKSALNNTFKMLLKRVLSQKPF